MKGKIKKYVALVLSDESLQTLTLMYQSARKRALAEMENWKRDDGLEPLLPHLVEQCFKAGSLADTFAHFVFCQRVLVFCGVTLAGANFIKMLVFDRTGVPVACVVCLTLIVAVTVAKLIGCSLPMIARRIGFDPAVMASPFITTIVDALSLLVYFRFATLILHIG